MYTITKEGRWYKIYLRGIDTGAKQRAKKNILHAYYGMTGQSFNGMIVSKQSMMFEEMTVAELCDAIKEAFYKGEEYKDHYQTLCLELKDRLEYTSV